MIIYLVDRYFWPDISAVSLLLTDLAEDLQAAGHELHVFTSRQLYNQPQANCRPKRFGKESTSTAWGRVASAAGISGSAWWMPLPFI